MRQGVGYVGEIEGMLCQYKIKQTISANASIISHYSIIGM